MPLKDLYAKERTSCAKMAPGLSEKVLYPTNLERQCVTFATKLFDEKNVAALKMLESENVSGVIEFLQQIISWWNVVNVKTPMKGKCLRQSECNPVQQDSSHDNN